LPEVFPSTDSEEAVLTGDAARTLDLSSKTFEEFVAFFFAREVVSDGEQFDYFLREPSGEQYDEAVFSSPEVIVGHMTKLFAEFGRIASAYPLAQLNQGIWGLLGENLRLYELFWDSSVPLEKRVQCIRSMYSVYSDFVSKSEVEVMENCFDMWWDLILHGFWFQPRLFDQGIQMGDVSKLDTESRRMLDVMFETLQHILGLSDDQGYALHGLGHLHHPGVRETVQKFISIHKSELTQQGPPLGRTVPRWNGHVTKDAHSRFRATGGELRIANSL
jgi:hypothetical protein